LLFEKKGFLAEWIQNILGHASYKMTMGIYETLPSMKCSDKRETYNRSECLCIISKGNYEN